MLIFNIHNNKNYFANDFKIIKEKLKYVLAFNL